MFNPIYRNHANKGTADHEPWASGPQQEAIRRRYIELRYKLLPYIYTGIEESTRTGLPFMRPIFIEYPQLESSYDDDRDFLFGPDLFVVPVVTEKVDPLQIALPPGQWYDFWTSQKHASTEKITVSPAIDEVPLYVRAGAIIPMQPLIQSTSETPKGSLQLRVYTGDDCQGSLYEDDGHTFAYQRGNFLRMTYTCQAGPNSITVSSATDKNGFQPWWKSTEVTILGVSSKPKEFRINDQSTREWRYDSHSQAVTVTVPDAIKPWTIKAGF